MSKEYYKKAKKIFPQFNRETDTVISGRPNPYQKQMAKNIADYNFNRATREGLVDPFGVKQRGYTKNQEGYNYHMLVNKKSDSPLDCWKGYERVPGTKPGAKGSCRKSSPANQNHYGESRGEGHKSGERFRSDPADRKAVEALSQVQKDSLHNQANLYGKPFFSPKHGVNVDPEDGVLSNRPVYSDNTKLTYDKIDRPFTSPMNATKGGGTTKVCLPQDKVNNMSPEQKKKVVAAKESAGRSGKRERSEGSEVKGAREKGATLRDWFEKENWVNVKTGEECGAPTKMISPLNIKEEAYEKQNREMRKKHKKETGNTLGERQTTGKGKRRVSFACRFGSMAGSMTDKNGEPSKLAMALKKWGFSSKGEAKAFCNKNKES